MTEEESSRIRISALEREVADLQKQQQYYVRQREIDLQLATISETLRRIEADLANAKNQMTEKSTLDRLEREIAEVKSQINEIKKSFASQGDEIRQLQINVLKYIVITIISFFVTIVAGILIAFIAHLI